MIKYVFSGIGMIVFVAFSLSQFAVFLTPYLAIKYTFWVELAMVVGQLVFQSFFLLHKTLQKVTTYLWYVLVVSSIGSAFLWLFIGLNALYPLGNRTALTYFMIVVTIMYGIHQERVHSLKLPKYLCYTWISYRFLVLTFILKWSIFNL